MLKTSLYDLHRQAGAKMVDFVGWSMPIQYQNLKDEVQTIRNHAGMFDASHMGEFFITGPQSTAFVDFLLTANFQDLPLNKALYSPMLNHEGRILDDLIAYKLETDKAMLCVNASNKDKDLKWIQSLVEPFDCQLTDKSEDFSLIAVQGPESYALLKKLPEFKNLRDMDYYAVFEQADGIITARTGYTGEDGFEIFGPHEILQKLWSDFLNVGIKPCGLGARDVLRIEVCYPLYGHELTEDWTPLDCGLKWTVKLNKKSFVGKEALIDYQAQYQLVKLSLEKGIPRSGYKVQDGQDNTIGFVTSGTQSVSIEKGIALALIERKLLPENQEYYIDIRGKKYQALKNIKPFVTGSHK